MYSDLPVLVNQMTQAADRLGHYAHSPDEQEAFVQELVGYGCALEQAKLLWKAIDHQFKPQANNSELPDSITSNTQLAGYFGVRLERVEGKPGFPRCSILYILADYYLWNYIFTPPTPETKNWQRQWKRKSPNDGRKHPSLLTVRKGIVSELPLCRVFQGMAPITEIPQRTARPAQPVPRYGYRNKPSSHHFAK